MHIVLEIDESLVSTIDPPIENPVKITIVLDKTKFKEVIKWNDYYKHSLYDKLEWLITANPEERAIEYEHQ